MSLLAVFMKCQVESQTGEKLLPELKNKHWKEAALNYLCSIFKAYIPSKLVNGRVLYS